MRARLFRWFARRVGAIGRDRLEPMLAGGWRRRAFIGGLFRAMPRVVRRKALEREQVLIEWRVSGRPDGRHDVRRLLVAGGRAIVHPDGRDAPTADQRPDLRITVPAAELLLVATGNANAPALFARGTLEIEGDPWLAARLPRFFATPRRRTD